MSYITDIFEEVESNSNFRKVLFTGEKSQLVVMDIPVGGEIGEEVHPNVEQTLFFLSGSGKAVIDGEETEVSAGDVAVVTPGAKHNFLNTGSESLKVATIYASANHIDGRIHATKEDADKDTEDEEFGHSRD
jgi:mannose-6-phosphate isomerase-like protein (cupin superfamily)